MCDVYSGAAEFRPQGSSAPCSNQHLSDHKPVLRMFQLGGSELCDVCVCTHVCAHVCAHVCMYARVCACVRAFVCACVW